MKLVWSPALPGTTMPYGPFGLIRIWVQNGVLLLGRHHDQDPSPRSDSAI